MFFCGCVLKTADQAKTLRPEPYDVSKMLQLQTLEMEEPKRYQNRMFDPLKVPQASLFL